MLIPHGSTTKRLDRRTLLPALLTRRSSDRPRAWVIGTALGLFAVVFFLRLTITGEDARILLLNAVPIALLGLEAGRRGGIVGATIATASVGLWSSLQNLELSLMSYLPRVTTFFLIGILVGHLAEHVRRAREAQHGLLELAPDSALTIDLDGHVTIANSAAQGLFGYGPDELTGLPVDQLVPDFFAALRRSLLRPGDREHDFVLTACSKDRSERLVHATVDGLGSDAGVLLLTLRNAEAP